MDIEPEAALRRANDKFQQRFTAVEQRVKAEGRQMRDVGLSGLEAHWQSVKNETT
jgi:uncharacterized protein YabN with tetrapyrrole methylase and pyrophosphatase domain